MNQYNSYSKELNVVVQDEEFVPFFSISSVDNEMVSSLALQMSLYFNTYFFPLWWVSSVMMLQLKVSSCFNISPEVSSAHPSIVTLSIKLEFLIFFVSQVHFTICEILQTCLFLFFFLVFDLAWLLQIHCGHCYHPNNLNRSYQVVSRLHG